jgi:DNA-binding transcriptional MerR regulator
MLSIGEFSKLCMVTTKTLRHYDLMGLLKPKELNDENGYRYYSVEQLSVMLKILRLKDYGFSLEEIKPLIDADDDKLMNAMKQKLIKQELLIEQEKHKLHRLKKDIEDLKKGDFMKQQFQISLVETAPVNIATVRETIAIKDFHVIMQKLFACGLPCEGAPVAIYHCPDFNPESTDVEVGFPTSVKSEKTRILEGGLCAKGVHYGDYSSLHESYMAMGKWIEENGYRVVRPPYEKYINDPANTPSQDLITEIYFPIEK